MQITDFYNGSNSILYVEFNNSFAPVACLTSHSINEVADSLETSISTSFDGSWRTYTPDFQSYTINASGLKINDQTQFAERASLPKLKTLKAFAYYF